ALPPDALEMTQKIIDQLREDLASMTYQACADAINGDDDDNGDEEQEEEQE
ncbi:DNA breaking-rejoining protein, partial [Salmonella enterica]|nr:DNA breaking-rejoining protein [Salmonella enterica]